MIMFATNVSQSEHGIDSFGIKTSRIKYADIRTLVTSKHENIQTREQINETCAYFYAL